MDRWFDVGTIVVVSTDRTSPELRMRGIEHVKAVADLIDSTRRAERQRRGLHLEATYVRATTNEAPQLPKNRLTEIQRLRSAFRATVRRILLRNRVGRRAFCRRNIARSVILGRRPIVFRCRGPIAPAARAGNVHRLAVLGDRAAGDRDAGFAELFDDRIVGQRLGLVFVVDDLLQLDPHAVPGHFLAVGAPSCRRRRTA